jgi:hypothetical protein
VLLVRAGWVGIDPVSTRAIRSGSAEVSSHELHRPGPRLARSAACTGAAARLRAASGLDPASVFDEAATHGPATIEQHVKRFGARTDVTPAAFGFRLDEDVVPLRLARVITSLGLITAPRGTARATRLRE